MSKFGVHNNKSAKLSPTQVLELRQRFRAGWTQGALARAYQISVGQVGRITRGESWQAYQNPADELSPSEIDAMACRSAAMVDQFLGGKTHEPTQETGTGQAKGESTEAPAVERGSTVESGDAGDKGIAHLIERAKGYTG